MPDSRAPDAQTAKIEIPADARPVPFRGGGFHHRRHPFLAPVVLLILLALWQAGSSTGFISPIAMPAPKDVFGAFRDLITTGALWTNLSVSLYRLLVGWLLGAALGIAVGLMIGLFSHARASALPIVSALFPVPKIALLPLFIIWFGIGEGSKVATILFGTFFPTVISTYAGVDAVDRGLIRMGQSFGLKWSSIVRKIILPGAMPGILSGFRISFSIAIVLLVAAEMIGAQHGIGAYILMAGSIFNLGELFAGVIILSAIGLVGSWLIGLAEKRLLDWRA